MADIFLVIVGLLVGTFFFYLVVQSMKLKLSFPIELQSAIENMPVGDIQNKYVLNDSEVSCK